MRLLWLPVALSAAIAVRPQLVGRSASGDTLTGQDDDRGLLRMIRAAALFAVVLFLAISLYQFIPE